MRLQPRSYRIEDKSPKVSLRDGADRLGVTYGKLRRLAVVAGLKPCLTHSNPNRHYYSLAALASLLKESQVVTVQAAPAAKEVPAAA